MRALEIDKIIEVIANNYSFSVEEIKGERKRRNLSRPRAICAYVLHFEFQLSKIDIGDIFKRDNSTVHAMLKNVDDSTFANIEEEAETMRGVAREAIKQKLLIKNQEPVEEITFHYGDNQSCFGMYFMSIV